MLRTARAATEVRATPSGEAEAVDRLGSDAVFAVLEYAGGWAWGYVQATHLVGYVPADALAEPA